MLEVTNKIIGAIYLNNITPSNSVCVRYTDQDEVWLNQLFIKGQSVDYISEIIKTDVENISMVDQTPRKVTMKNGIPNLLIIVEDYILKGEDCVKLSVTLQPKKRRTHG